MWLHRTAGSLWADLTNPPPKPAPRRRVAVAAILLVTWVAGTVLGTSPATDPARAAPHFQLQAAHADYMPTLDGTEPIFILLLGSDARTDNGEPIDGSRSDAIQLIGINPARHRACVMGFPRDSWVEIPGYGIGKINSAMVLGGPQLAIETIEELTGIQIDYYALSGFHEFENIFRAVGGLTIDLPNPVLDDTVNADFQPGVQTLSGPDVLRVARAREQLPYGDFDRSMNQGRILLAALQQFQKGFTKDPSSLLTWVSAGMRNIQTDISLQEILVLGFTAATINPKHVQNFVLPATTGAEGAQSVVHLSATNTALYRDMGDDGFLEAGDVPDFPPSGPS